MAKVKKQARGPIIRVGATVIIRTVTHYYTGRIIRMTATELELEDAAWIADTGRWSKALTQGELTEVEPYPVGVSIARGSIIDVSPWLHALPRNVQ